MNFVTVIMAGGSGTRFWPASRKAFPKQYLSLFGTKSLIQETVERMKPLSSTKDIFICSGKSQSALLKEQLSDIPNLILEPVGRNTAPCLMLTVATLLTKGYPLSTPLLVLPADHYIGNSSVFHNLVKDAVHFASTHSALVTLGIAPTSPHTGYGYIEAGHSVEQTHFFQVKRFVEKPSLEKANEFLRSNTFYWNAGIFIWSLASISKALEDFLPEEWAQVQSAVSSRSETALASTFEKLKSQPIDTAVLERADNVFVLPALNLQWSDIGSWNALFELQSKNVSENVILSGQVRSVESTGCLVKTNTLKEIALAGVSDLVIVEDNGTLLITHRTKDQLVKEVAKD